MLFKRKAAHAPTNEASTATSNAAQSANDNGAAPPTVVVRELKERLLNKFRSPNYKPPVLPAVAAELLALSRRADVSLQDVTRTLERDPILAAAVLKLAQSPLYSSRVRPDSVSAAVQRLGLLTVRDMVLQLVVEMRVFRAPGYEQLMESLRRHCIVTAHVTRLICKHTSLAADQAFLCGLLHDVGFGGVLLALGELPSKERPPLTAVLGVATDMHHEAGSMMARIWELAPDIQWVIEHHHDFDGGRATHPLVAAVVLAEAIAYENGARVCLPFQVDFEVQHLVESLDLPRPHWGETAAQSLGLSPATRKLIETEGARIAQEVLATSTR